MEEEEGYSVEQEDDMQDDQRGDEEEEEDDDDAVVVIGQMLYLLTIKIYCGFVNFCWYQFYWFGENLISCHFCLILNQYCIRSCVFLFLAVLVELQEN